MYPRHLLLRVHVPKLVYALAPKYIRIWVHGPLPQGSKYPIIIYSPKSYLHNYYPKTEYLIIGSFGPLGLDLGYRELEP